MKKTHLPFLSWIIIPILGMWIATNYLVGIFKEPRWTKTQAENMNMQTMAHTEGTNEPPSYHWKGEGLITFWFDDAWDSQYFVAFPLLKEKGFKAALAVPSKAIGWDTYMNWAQVRRLSYQGWEITAHSRSHECDVARLNTQTLEDELIGSKEDLKNQGYEVSLYVPPCGVITPQLLDLVKNHYLGLRTSDTELNLLPVKDPYNLQIVEVQTDITLENVKLWINETKINGAWLILMFHKIDLSFEQFSTRPQILKEIINEVQRSKVKVILPSEALNLIDDR